MKISSNLPFYRYTILILLIHLSICGCSKKQPPPLLKGGIDQVTTLAGSVTPGSADGKGAQASFASIWAITVDGVGNIYLTDTRLNQVRKITPQGVVTTLSDNGPGSTNGFGVPTIYSDPLGIAIDASGNIYVSYLSSAVVRKIPLNGKGAVFAGGGQGLNRDGVGSAASFSQPVGLTVDQSGNIYVAGYSSSSIRKISPLGVVTTLAGSGRAGSTDGKGLAAGFNLPNGVTVDATGNVYVADSGNNLIRKITPDGTVSTVAGSGTVGHADGQGTAASFNYPEGIAVDNAGNIYIADTNNNMIRRITSAGLVSTLAGTGTAGSANGTGAAASFNIPTDLALNQNGSLLYVADRGNNEVRQIVLK